MHLLNIHAERWIHHYHLSVHSFCEEQVSHDCSNKKLSALGSYRSGSYRIDHPRVKHDPHLVPLHYCTFSELSRTTIIRVAGKLVSISFYNRR